MKTWLLTAALAVAPIASQDLSIPSATHEKNHQYIVYDSEQQSVPAGKHAMLELRFQLEDGFHVNSHTPKSDLLIPTQLTLDPADGVKVAPIEYPAGKTFSFRFDPDEKLDVYAESFTLKLPVTASPGDHEVHGTLRYQACNQAACYPPRTLPISVLFKAK